jgi:hypothetical protein
MATLESVVETGQTSRAPREIEVPASTAWPLVLALGFTLICAGLLTRVSVSVLGAVVFSRQREGPCFSHTVKSFRSPWITCHSAVARGRRLPALSINAARQSVGSNLRR